MDSAVHYRIGGRARPGLPEPYVERRGTGRAIFAHLVPIGQMVTIPARDGKPEFREWFTRGSLRMSYPAPGFWLRHAAEGGTRVGKVIRLVEAVSWVDGIMLVDDNEVGDAFLEDIGPDGGDLPISIGFRPVSNVTYPEGIQRVKAELTEVAVTDVGAYGAGARTFARGFLPPPTAKRRT